MATIVRHNFKLVDKTTGVILHSLEFDETFVWERARDYAKQYRDRFCHKHNVPKSKVILR